MKHLYDNMVRIKRNAKNRHNDKVTDYFNLNIPTQKKFIHSIEQVLIPEVERLKGLGALQRWNAIDEDAIYTMANWLRKGNSFNRKQWDGKMAKALRKVNHGIRLASPQDEVFPIKIEDWFESLGITVGPDLTDLESHEIEVERAHLRRAGKFEWDEKDPDAKWHTSTFATMFTEDEFNGDVLESEDTLFVGALATLDQAKHYTSNWFATWDRYRKKHSYLPDHDPIDIPPVNTADLELLLWAVAKEAYRLGWEEGRNDLIDTIEKTLEDAA